MRRELRDPIVSTHLLFVGNAVLYWTASFYILAITLILCTVASFLYHLSNETDLLWKQTDHILCIVSLLIIFSHLALYSSMTCFIYCIAWLVFSLCIYKASRFNYQIIHTIWHGAVSVGNLLVWYCLVYGG